MSKTIIISNRFPVKVSEKNGDFDLNPAEGGLATGLGSVYKNGDNVWIGWPGLQINGEKNQLIIKDRLSELNLLPVFLSSQEISEFYEGFSNEILWPIFHYYAPTHSDYKQSNWDYYQSVNQKFFEEVIKVAQAGDKIWIHDYQLLLLPGLIRAALPDVSIGFFLHIPFPSFEIFRLIPWRCELIEGMLGADLLGFHTFDDVSHFLDTAVRLLPVACSANELSVDGRIVVAESFPMGIDNEKYASLTTQHNVVREIDKLQEANKGRRMILAIDRLDYSKGILQRLQAFERLLQLHPEYIGNVILHMIVVPSRDNVPQYRELKELIDRKVGEINARNRTIDWVPVHYFYRSFPVETLAALYHNADVCMVTPMRDGMNLVSKEYVASRTQNTGVLILSEMAGASKELVDALIVNPSNITSMADTIFRALTMPEEEQKRRMKLMRQVVAKFNIYHWVKIYMEKLLEVKNQQHSMNTRIISPITEQAIKKVYNKANNRIIFLDYDGTLVEFKPEINSAKPDAELYELLDLLHSDPSNYLVLVSGRDHNTLEEWFGHMDLNLIAEHGAWQKRNGNWESVQGLNDQWKQDIYPVLETYMDRTPGAFIEEKDFSLVWHYRKVEKGLGELRTAELMNNLRYLINDRGLQLLPGNKVVEIKNIEINKGKAALAQLHNKEYDFVMAFGDDHTDEDIFKVIPESSVSIKVGSNISSARFYLRSPVEVRKLLRDLIEPVEVQ
ncbi:bifunctional alpha,alpha-trehalose-phosphate synthase (UDP-forming)/trehalose-phosphatase [Pedobacter sp. P351]|uniref:bifunctional alpha,alpha-trehalose-phosphate synthase (UDP-forming)/trehalose-phosphatase n=1 Tax=Pedobacter superstes TaxID=3133441 RepID=UPI00309FFDE7